MKNGIKVSAWAEADQPYNKLLNKGKLALTDAEVLAILLRNGNDEKDVVSLAQEILSSYGGSLLELSSATAGELKKFKGIGDAKALAIISAFELARRKRIQTTGRKIEINSSQLAFEAIFPHFNHEGVEEFYALYLNKANNPISVKLISQGGYDSTVVDPKVVLRQALECKACGIILSHNHPSGRLFPSDSDIRITEKIKQSALLMDIKVLDHLIVGAQEAYYSFADEGRL